ncbi:hypothetical protein EMCRGX_G000132 [Ephydatia muelleri]
MCHAKVPRLSDIKELRLGLTNYYRCFMQGYSNIAAPLHKLTSKSAGGYNWDDNCQAAFQTLKQKLISPPILAYPDFKHSFTIATDASGSALRAILNQAVEGEEKVIAFWSRHLNKAERKSFILLTDHNPLTSLRGLKDTGGRLTRWLLFLQQYDITIKYRAGRSNGNADAMSRRKCEFKESAQQAVVEDSNAIVGGITYLGDLGGLLKQKQDNDSFTKSILQSTREGRKLPMKRKDGASTWSLTVYCAVKVGMVGPQELKLSYHRN